jgi:Winged helix DNA-binding domain
MADVGVEVSWSQVGAWRFAAHGLAARAEAGSVVEVARALCGLHAQLMSSAELTAWARVEGLSAGFAAPLLSESRSLVKVWAMRGTLHLLPADELGLWLGGLASMRHFLTPGWARGFGLEAGQIEQVIEAVGVALDGAALTREQLSGAVAAELGDERLAEALAHSFGSTLKPAAYRGKLLFADPDGQKVRFARPEQWLRDPLAVVDADAAMETIVLRCLGVHGPLTREELARWWGGKSPEPGRALERLGELVASVDVEGEQRWARSEDVAALSRCAPGADVVRLLPAFDQYAVAATRHSDGLTVGSASRSARIYRPQGWLSPVVCVDGAFAGLWTWERKGPSRVVVEVEPFAARVPRALRAGVEEEASRLATFLGADLSLSWA